ncbi:MAG: type II secretion system protein, partial [Oscillibacter sp.]
MKRAKGQRNRRGFTMAEVLTVIAIFAVLAAVAFPAVAQIQKRLDMAQLDEYARQIFLAAQNEVTAMKASGRLEGFAQALKGQEVDKMPADYPEKAAPWENLRIVSDEDAAAATYLLRSGSALTDATQGGHFLLELNPATGDVYSAFYAQDIIDYTSVQATCLKDRNRDTRQPSQLGYYGGSIGTSGSVGAPQTFRPKLNIVNGEELYLTVTCDGLLPLISTQQGLSLTVTITDEHKKTWSKIWRGGNLDMVLSSDSIAVQLVLDSLDSEQAFAAVTAGSLTPGDNLTITAAMAYANAGVNITGAATPVT